MVRPTTASHTHLDRTEPSSAYARSLDFHARWLEKRGIRHRPWFMLASAPAPTIPAVLPPNVAHVHVKYAGHSAQKLGLSDADLTLLLKKTTPNQIEGIRFENILRMDKRFTIETRLRRMFGLVDTPLCEIKRRERDDFIIATMGSLFRNVGTEDRPSNGISLLCYAIALGVPQIILAGMSLRSNGHAYAPGDRKRRHVAEDLAALRTAAERYPQVLTTEPELHEDTGLPMYRA